jgi:hypothetical protein
MKRIAIIVRATHPDRVAEALRAAVGLSLRGDRVHVVVAAAARPACAHAQAARALATLRMLGHDVIDAEPDTGTAEADAVRMADAIEVWT